MTKELGGIDRRRHGRAPIQMEAVLQGKTPDKTVRLQILNFSVGGFFCLIDRAMEEMTRLAIRFVFPAFGEEPPRTIDCVALVVRCEPSARKGEGNKLAACFTELSPADRDHIQSYVDWVSVVNETADRSFSTEPPL